eukprot:6214538-Pleurochrysis_carterae.AAC.2
MQLRNGARVSGLVDLQRWRAYQGAPLLPLTPVRPVELARARAVALLERLLCRAQQCGQQLAVGDVEAEPVVIGPGGGDGALKQERADVVHGGVSRDHRNLGRADGGLGLRHGACARPPSGGDNSPHGPLLRRVAVPRRARAGERLCRRPRSAPPGCHPAGEHPHRVRATRRAGRGVGLVLRRGKAHPFRQKLIPEVACSGLAGAGTPLVASRFRLSAADRLHKGACRGLRCRPCGCPRAWVAREEKDERGPVAGGDEEVRIAAWLRGIALALGHVLVALRAQCSVDGAA